MIQCSVRQQLQLPLPLSQPDCELLLFRLLQVSLFQPQPMQLPLALQQPEPPLELVLQEPLPQELLAR